MALIPVLLALVMVAAVPGAMGASDGKLPNGFVTKRPAGGAQQRTAGGNNWNNPAWQAIQSNITGQLRNVDASFESYKGRRGRRYRNSAAERKARGNFQSNLEYIHKENAKKTNTYVLGVTNFTDMSYAEFAAKYLMHEDKLPKDAQVLNNARRRSRSLLQTTNNTQATSECGVYWAADSANPLGKNVVSSVKNQGLCGSCWAFAAAAQVESWRAMQNTTLDTGNFMDVSEQMLVDCSYGSTVNGCLGGWPTDSWDFIKSNGGVAAESADPYVSGATGTGTLTCPLTTTPRALGSNVIKDYAQVSPPNDTGLVAALKTQPVVTAVSAGPEFQNYVGGAISCASNALNHAVQTVGCGYIPSADGTSYVPVYVIKNQWSAYWGYGGFAYLLRSTEAGGNCGLAAFAYTVS